MSLRSQIEQRADNHDSVFVEFDPHQIDGIVIPLIPYFDGIIGRVHCAQGMTVDEAVVLLDSTFSRHDCLVAASRACDTTALIVDAKAIDRRLIAELPIDRQRDDLAFSETERREWLAERISRAAPKISTLDVIEMPHAVLPQQDWRPYRPSITQTR
ncbi:MAG: hypothetical protein HYX37_14745 [Rhizobiales bacterium]|nr:hypothetical protein [Hyphomicrobiales bacterium]